MTKKTTIISLGGSLIVPEEIDWKFIGNLSKNLKRPLKNIFKKNINLLLSPVGEG